MELTKNGTKLLDVEDFRRLGVRPNECRLTVIRRAAAKSTKSLAEQQLTSPSPQVELQLTAVATSTYRLLDPRKRNDVYQRAFIGRILPNALMWAGRTSFHNGSAAHARKNAEAPFRSEVPGDAELIEMLELSPAETVLSTQPDRWTRSLSADDLIQAGGYRSRRRRIRRNMSRPAKLLALTLVLVASTFWLANWSIERDQLSLQRVADATQKPDELMIPDLSAATLEVMPEKEVVPEEEVLPKQEIVSVDAQPQALSTDIASATPDTAAPSPDAIAAVTPIDPVVPNDPSPSPLDPADNPLDPADNDMLAEVDVMPQSVPPLNMTFPFSAGGSQSPNFAELDEVDTNPPPMSDEPTFDTLAMPELGPIVSHIKEYALDLLKSDPWAKDPLPETDELATSEAIETMLSEEMTEVPETPSREVAPVPTRRYSVPAIEESILAREQWAVLEPVLIRGIEPGEATVVIKRIDDLIPRLEIGNAEHWTACMIAAEIAWTVEDLPAVESRLQPLVENYETDLQTRLAASFVGAVTLTDLPETHEHLLNVGSRLSEQLLLAELFDSCNQVVAATRRSADVLEDEAAAAYLDQFTASVSQMSRWAESVSTIVNADGEILETATSDKIGIAGRYHCLMLRSWKTGLPWLVEATDPRISGLAERELSLDADAAADDLSELAELWSAAAARATGRAADSMRLRAIELLQRSCQQSSGLKKLEAERLIEEIEQTLPPLVSVPKVSKTSPQDQPMTVTPQVSPESNDRAEPGLVGRVRIDGQEVGVRLIYESGASISGLVIEQISERLGQPIETFEVEFDGVFELTEPLTVQAALAQVAGVTQTVTIDETLLDLDDATVSLEAGRHRFRWAIEATEISPVFLRVQELESGREIEFAHPESAADDTLPTELTVRMVRRSQ